MTFDFNERTNTLLYKNISLTLHSRKGWCFCGVWEVGGEAYSERGLLLPISSSRSQGMPTPAPTCELVRDASARLRVPCSTAISCTLSKSDRVVLITWSPSGYTPVRPKWPDAPSSPCLLIKIWQLTKAHVICYITLSCQNWSHILNLKKGHVNQGD